MTVASTLDLPRDYGQRIRRLRERLAMNQTQLGELLGVSIATVSRWESGALKPSLSQWQILLEAEEHGAYALRRPHANPKMADAPSPLLAPGGEPSTVIDFGGNPEAVRAVAEAERLSYGHLFNPAFAAETSLVEPLPHQRIAVYDRMLPQSRIRFLLADDPGAGKTIMSGLLIRELLSRKLVRRILVVPPAGLVANWKREMRTLFHLPFEILLGADARARNPFVGQESDLAIISMDTLAGDRVFARLQEPAVVPYDMVFFDEAHKLSASLNFDFTVNKTDRYLLAEALAGVHSSDPRWSLAWSAHHLVLLTATPHMGRPYPYYALWRLLDPHMFGSIEGFNRCPADRRKTFFIRRMKEEMVRYDRTRIYPKRVSDTLGCQMSADEEQLYKATTDYISAYYNKARMLNRAAARLAMSVFQRRLTSSTWALLRSFERRLEKLDTLIEDIRSGKLSISDLQARQKKLDARLPDPIDTKTADEEEGEETEEVETEALGGVIAVNLKELLAERAQVKGLCDDAKRVYEKGQESKFEKLREVIQDARWRDEKLLIFTEHRDTLDFIVRRLGGIGLSGKIATIHGGMATGEEADVERLTERQDNVEFFRRPAAEGGATYMVCTDAAAEGINLQFCWLMVNYDIPWNPARLEQRMGRIHRFGQKHDPVHIVNLVADPEKTREGRVLKTLLDKLENIRKEMGSGKVFDVIGRLFQGKTLASYMEDVVLKGADDGERAIAAIASKERVEEIEREEKQLYGDEGEVERELDKLSEKLVVEDLRRLMPGYVRRFVERAVPLLNIDLGGDLNGVFSLRSLQPGALDPLLPAIESYPREKQNRFSFRKPSADTTGSTVFFHPGEAVFDRMREWVAVRFERDSRRGAVFVDAESTAPYLFDLALVSIVRRADTSLAPLAREETIENRLVGVRRAEVGGSLELCPVEHLLLLRGGEGIPVAARKLAGSAAEGVAGVREFLVAQGATAMLAPHRDRLVASLSEREDYIRQGYDFQEADLAGARAKLKEKADAGSVNAKVELGNIRKRQEELPKRRDEALAVVRREPELLDVGDIEFIAHALIVPSSDPADKERQTTEIEMAAMRVARAIEEREGAVVTDVHVPELALAAGLSSYPGFDMLSHRPGGERRCIEVKGRARVGEIEMKENEWAAAITRREEYWLYVVFDCATERPRPIIVRDPFKALIANPKGGVIIDATSVLAHEGR